MNKKISFGTVISLVLIAIAVTFSLTMVYSAGVFSDKMHDIKDREAFYSKLSEIDNIVRSNALTDVENEHLMDCVAEGYINGMNDIYADYMTAEDYQSKIQNKEKQVGEIGVEVSMDESGYMYVEYVTENSPADEAGVLAGDLIVKIDSEEVKTDNFEKCEKMLVNDPGTVVTLDIRRESKEKTFEITRRILEKPTVLSKKIDNYGYIRIYSFENSTTNQFNKALDELLNNNVEGIIFDVRNNSGGTIHSVCSTLDRLLPEGPIVSATYKNGSTEVLKYSDEFEVNLPMVVIANENSASAAELFVQALRDYNKAKFVGKTTFGKGLMQTVYQLTDGSALEITVAKYNPPSSGNFDGVGLNPDFEVDLDPSLADMIDVINITDDAQLKKAIDVLSAEVKKISDENASSSSSSSENK